MLKERLVPVCQDPIVELFVSETPTQRSQTLLVIHGGPGWDQTYLHEPLVELQDERQVVFVDLRGCGGSTRRLPPDAHTPAGATQDLVALLESVATQPVDVLGFSYGGMLAQRLVVTAPDHVRRLIVASSSVLPVPADAFSGWRQRDERVVAQPPVLGYDDDDDTYDDERVRQDAISSAAANIWRLELLPEYLDRLDQVRFSCDWSNAWPDHSRMPPSRPNNVVEELRFLGLPVLLLHGQQDMTFPASLVEQTLKLMPNACAAVIPEAGHMAHIDQPLAWLNALRQFLG